MPISVAIPLDIGLTKEELQLADEMLGVVISKWERLGECSIAALRNTFFDRQGILEKQEKSYQISLESRGQDILLDYIPWNMGMIELSWIDELILISWR